MKQIVFFAALLILVSCATQKNPSDVMSERQVRKILDDEFDKYGVILEYRATSHPQKSIFTYGDEEEIREYARNTVRIINRSKDITPLDKKDIKHINSCKYWENRIRNQEKGRGTYRWSEKECLYAEFLLDNIFYKDKTSFEIGDVYVNNDKNFKDKTFVENIRNVKWKLVKDAPIEVKFSFDFTYKGEDYSLTCKYKRDYDAREFLKSLGMVWPGGLPESLKTPETRERYSKVPGSNMKRQFPINFVRVKRISPQR